MQSCLPLVIALLIRIGWVVMKGDALNDIDYRIFSEAADYVLQGKSPYDRQTYRYTPVLSFLMIPGRLLKWPSFGKLIFGLGDVAVGWMLHKGFGCGWSSICFWWLFNPFVFILSQRGSADCLLGLLTLVFLWCWERSIRMPEKFKFAVLSGASFALSVHFKIIPIIYTPLLFFNWHSQVLQKSGWKIAVLQAATIAISAISVFGGTCSVFLWRYKMKFLEDSFLYHFSRQDHRHNFSPNFYPTFFLLEQGNLSLLRLYNTLYSLPLGCLLLIIAAKYANDLRFGITLSTIAFVVFNRVITSQYFCWIFWMLPLCQPLHHKPLIGWPLLGCFLLIHVILLNSYDNVIM